MSEMVEPPHLDCFACYRAAGRVPWHMVVCRTCGNKRCPKATDHRLKCTASNEPGQPGSAYAALASEPNP